MKKQKLLFPLPSPAVFLLYFIFIFFIYGSQRERERERERGRDIGRGRSRLHAPGARRGTRSWVSRIAPWAKGRRQTAAPPRDPSPAVLSKAKVDYFSTDSR